MRRIVAPIALLLAAVGALSGCGAHADAGSRVRTDEKVTGTSTTLPSPLGTAHVTVGTAVKTIDKSEANDLKKHQAPSGGAFVPVSWDWTFTTGFPFSDLGVLDHAATISLVAGGHSYRLDTVSHTFGSAQPEYVAVPTTKDLKVGLAYDGQTQTVDVASGTRSSGVAAGMYDVRTRTIDCAKGWSVPAPVTTDMECSLRASTVPWAGRWAEPGHEFVVVSADIRPYPFEIERGGSTARYRVTGITDHSALDGAAPQQPLQRDPSVEYHADGTLVFDVPTGAHTLDLSLDYTLQKQGQDGAGSFPLARTITLTRSVPIS